MSGNSAEQPARQLADDKDQDIEIMWNDLNTEIHSKRSAAQPAFSYRIEGNLMTLFFDNWGKLVSEKNIDTEGGVLSIPAAFSSSVVQTA